MREAEARELPFLLKLRLTANVKRMIEKLASAREWVDAGQGFEAKESEVRLVGWSRQRRVIVLRRRLKDAVGLRLSDDGGPPQLAFVEIGEAAEVYEYSVLVTSLDEDDGSVRSALSRPGRRREHFRRDEEPMGLGRLYDARSCALPARGAAARALLQLVEHLRPARRSQPPSRGDHQPPAVPDGDRDPHASRPANDDPRDELARQGRARRQALAAVAAFLRGLAKNAEQLTRLQTWRAILSRAFQAFLNGRLLRAPPRLAPS